MRDATPIDVVEGRATWCVVCGERDEVLATFADGAIDVTITDPPYNARTHKGGGVKSLVNGEVCRVTLGFDAVTDFDFVQRMIAVTKRWCLAFCALEDLGEYQRASAESWVRAGVWHRTDGAPQFTGDRPAQGAEGVAIMHRRGKRTSWNHAYPVGWYELAGAGFAYPMGCFPREPWPLGVTHRVAPGRIGAEPGLAKN